MIGRRAEPYADRTEAGQALTEHLGQYADSGAVVLALPRGGVPVAAVVAQALGAALDVLVVRKLGLPGHAELAMGAIAGVGERVETVRNEDVLHESQVPEEEFADVYGRELAELRRREGAYRGGRPPVAIDGRTVLLIDDGLATGATMRAAIAAVRNRGPSRLVVAVPVAATRTCAALRPLVDELVCGWTPRPFLAVGQGYLDFAATSDEEVTRLLVAAART
ncbi:MAG: phosphoribosyltransferase [Jatrophihabitantaceae bacterium]